MDQISTITFPANDNPQLDISSENDLTQREVVLKEELLKREGGNINPKNNSNSKPSEGVKQRQSVLSQLFISASHLVESPLSTTNDTKENGENEKKMDFNYAVEDMAKYYINIDEQSQFHFCQFFETVFIHIIYFIFGPISAPLLFKVYPKDYLRNMGFWGKRVARSHLIQIYYWICFVITTLFTAIILYLNRSDRNNDYNKQYIFLCPAYIAQIMVFIRYVTVCVKYGFFPPGYYTKWKSQSITRTEIKTNYLLQGWIKPSVLVNDVYLKEIFEKLAIDVNQFKFQCVGTISEFMKNDILAIDKIIHEDVRKMRLSITRRVKKRTKFYDLIREVMRINKTKKRELQKLKEAEEAQGHSISQIPFDQKCDSLVTTMAFPGLPPSIEQMSNNTTSDLQDQLDQKDETFVSLSDEIHRCSEILSRKGTDKPLKGAERLRAIIITKVLPDVKRKLSIGKAMTLEGKINCKSDKLYEIQGIYLCRVILKNVFTSHLVSYAFIHKFLVAVLCAIPFAFTVLYYLENNNQYSKNISNGQNQSQNYTNTTISQQNSTSSNTKLTYIYFNSFTIVLIIFSAVVIIPPTWANTVNLLYGIIDLNRKKDLMEKITQLINTNKNIEKCEFPMLNIFDGKTMLNWYHLRTIVSNYGKRFTDRIIVQASIFCFFVIFALLFSVLSLFGYFEQFIALSLGASLTFSLLINFLIIFYMFLIGAGINWYEYTHQEIAMTQKLFIDSVLEMIRKSSSTGKRTAFAISEDIEYNSNSNSNSRTLSSHLLAKQPASPPKIEETQSKKIAYPLVGNINGALFLDIINSPEYKPKDRCQILIDTSRVLDNIREKIKIDGVVIPLKIFWVKAEYAIIGKIVALLISGLGMMLSTMTRAINFKNIISNV